MSEENITLLYYALIAKVNGQDHYFKWNGAGDLCTAPGIKGAAYFKRREAERIIKALKKRNFPHLINLIAIK